MCVSGDLPCACDSAVARVLTICMHAYYITRAPMLSSCVYGSLCVYVCMYVCMCVCVCVVYVCM